MVYTGTLLWLFNCLDVYSRVARCSAIHHILTPTREGWSHGDVSPLIRFSGGLDRHHAHFSPVSSGLCLARLVRRPRYRCRGFKSDVPDTLAFLVHGALTLSVPAALAPGTCDVPATLAPGACDVPATLAPGASALACQLCQY
jgi:hypothetical protein